MTYTVPHDVPQAYPKMEQQVVRKLSDLGQIIVRTMKAKTMLQFGLYQFDPTNACVWRGRQTISLRPKAFAVLHSLLEHAGQLVTKDELFRTVWPRVYVADGALKECIREIRHALKDKARTPQYVKTVHGRGYQFIGTVSP